MRIDRHRLRKLAKDLAFHTPLRTRMGPRYQYLHTPAELAFLCRCLDETRDVPGCIVEVGCYRGDTTLYLNYHMTSEGIEKPYAAIDTFSGFTEAHLEVDVQRGEDRDFHRNSFGSNDQRWFDAAMLRSRFTRGRVRSIAADVGAFDFEQLAPIAFCLLDVVFHDVVVSDPPTAVAKREEERGDTERDHDRGHSASHWRAAKHLGEFQYQCVRIARISHDVPP